MPFNLRRQRRPLRRLRKLIPDVRPSDLDGASEEELEQLLETLRQTKLAIGPGGSLGPGWTQVDSTYSPYTADPITTPKPWYGGGPFDKERQEQFPRGQQPLSSGPQKARNYPVSGNYPSESLNEKGPGKKTRPKDGFEWQLSLALQPWDDKEKVVETMSQFGDNVESDDRGVSLVVDDYEDAMVIQRMLPGVKVERRRRKM